MTTTADPAPGGLPLLSGRRDRATRSAGPVQTDRTVRGWSRRVGVLVGVLVGGRTAAVAGVIASGTAVLGAAGLALFVVAGQDAYVDLAVLTAAGLVSVPAVGRALVRTDARSKLGWLLVASGAATVARLVLDAYARSVFRDHATLPHAAAAELVSALLGPGQLALAGLSPLLLSGHLPAGRRWRVLAGLTGVIMALSLASAFSPTFWHFDDVHNPAGAGGGLGQVLGGLGMLVVLGQNVSNVGAARSVRAARQQRPPDAPEPTRHALILLGRAAWLVAGSFLACIVLGSTGMERVAYAVEHAALLVFAVCAWVAIRRFGLVDTRLVLERTLRYGLLTAGVVAGYVALVAFLDGELRGRLPGVIAVGLAALAGLLLRDGAQRGVARLVWGPAGDSTAALASLRERLSAAAAPMEVLVLTAAGLGESLTITGVRVRDAAGADLASWDSGAAVDRTREESLPLAFAGRPVGRLCLSLPAGERDLSRRQRLLLSGVIPHLAAAVEAVSAGRALAASQQRLTSLRDSERHRIRRDLHDGLGPTLAGIAWGLERARESATTDLQATVEQLERLAAGTRDVVADVRRLVHDLVPTRLEDLGLHAALRHDLEAMGASLHVGDAARQLTLPSSVELAAYRIALEAVTNATKHADAASIVVRLHARADAQEPGERALVIEVEDDGRGVAPDAVPGLGLASMRQRAGDCGGDLELRSAAPHGTLLHAVLPLASGPAPARLT